MVAQEQWDEIPLILVEKLMTNNPDKVAKALHNLATLIGLDDKDDTKIETIMSVESAANTIPMRTVTDGAAVAAVQYNHPTWPLLKHLAKFLEIMLHPVAISQN